MEIEKKPSQLMPWELPADALAQWKNSGTLFVPKAGLVIQMAENDHIAPITNLVSGNAALVGVSNLEQASATVSEFINDQRGLVALPQSSDSADIAAFQGLGLWPFGYCELRSARTREDFQGFGINTLMKKLMIHIAWERYHQPFIGFTEKLSGSRGILQKLGFSLLDNTVVDPRLAEACPPVSDFTEGCDQCMLRSDGDCGCQVYILDIAKYNGTTI